MATKSGLLLAWMGVYLPKGESSSGRAPWRMCTPASLLPATPSFSFLKNTPTTKKKKKITGRRYGDSVGVGEGWFKTHIPPSQKSDII